MCGTSIPRGLTARAGYEPSTEAALRESRGGRVFCSQVIHSQGWSSLPFGWRLILGENRDKIICRNCPNIFSKKTTLVLTPREPAKMPRLASLVVSYVCVLPYRREAFAGADF